MPEQMAQFAPWPADLEVLVAQVKYRPGWRAYLSDIERDPADTHGQPAGGLTLVIFADVQDTYHPEHRRPVNHFFIVPAATYSRAAWRRWLFDCYQKVEQHECCEWFALIDSHQEPDDKCRECEHLAHLHDGRNSSCAGKDCASHRFEAKTPRLIRPFAPTHGPGDDPYTIKELATDEQRRTSFRGVVKNATDG